MADNRGITYHGAFDLRVETIDFPKLEFRGKAIPHGVIVKVLATNICGSDQHIFRGRFPVPEGHVLGHEITGEVVEIGSDVEFLSVGDVVSVPFNVSCGRCRNCKTQHPEICQNVNEKADLGAYGFDLGGWLGGQSEYMLVPYADYALLKFPDAAQAKERLLELAFLSDILPTGYHGCVCAGVKPGSTVYIAGAGPVGRCAAASARLLGASRVIIGDMNTERLKVMESAGYETIDLSDSTPLADKIADLLSIPEVDCGVDAVGYEAHGLGDASSKETPGGAINSLLDIVRPGGGIGVPGIYVGEDAAAADADAKNGVLPLIFGKAWGKSLTITTGMAPVINYNGELMKAILAGRMEDLLPVMNVEVVSLDEGPAAYQSFSDGSPKKFVIDPHGVLAR